MACCSLAAVPPKSSTVTTVTADAEKAEMEDEEKLLSPATDSES